MPDSHSPLRILHEDNHLLVVDKPAGLATMGARRGASSLVSLVKAHLKRRYHKPGNVYLGVVSRLDAPVSGLVVLARTSKAAARLAEQFRQREVRKEYLALVEGRMNPPVGTLVQWLRHDDLCHRMRASSPGAAGAREARLEYRTEAVSSDFCLLRVILGTGRKHQIRVQCAERGHPILGDRKYGARLGFPEGIALHAARLQLRHPVRRELLDFSLDPPTIWRSYLARLRR